MYTVVTLFKLMKKKSLSRQAKLKLEIAIRHRINAGRVAIKDQIAFFRSDKLIGNDGLSFVNSLDLKKISDTMNLKLIESKKFKNDIFELRRFQK